MVANTRLSLQSPPPFNPRHLVNPETAHAIALWLALLLALLLPFSVASCADDDDDTPPDTTVDDDDNDATGNDDDLTSNDDDNDATADDDDITGNDDDDDDDDLTADDDDVTGDDDDNDATGNDDDDTTTDDDDDDDRLGPPKQGYGEAVPLPQQLRGLPVQGYAPPPSNYLMRMWVSEPQAAPFATNAPNVTLSGLILGVPSAVTWQTSRGKSGSALVEQLDDAAASFTAVSIPLEKGANTITFNAEGTLPTGRASTGSFTIDVTRAGGIVPEGPVVITNRAQPTCPNAVDPCVGKTIDIRAPLRYGDATVVKGSPRIEIVMNGEFAKACDLRDDGSLTTHHDEIAGDNIFSCKFPGLAIRSPKKLDLYVAWQLEGGETERYLAGDLEYFTAPDVEAADAEQAHFDTVAGAYETIMQATPRPTREEAEAAQRVMVAGLIEDPAVKMIYFHPDDGTAFVYYASGVNRIVSGGIGGDELSVPTRGPGATLRPKFTTVAPLPTYYTGAGKDEGANVIAATAPYTQCPAFEFPAPVTAPDQVFATLANLGTEKPGVLLISAHGEAQGPQTSKSINLPADPVVLFPATRPPGAALPPPDSMAFVWLKPGTSPPPIASYPSRAIWVGRSGENYALSDLFFAYAIPPEVRSGLLVYFSSCKSMWHAAFANALAPATVLGYTDYVLRQDAEAASKATMECMAKTARSNRGTAAFYCAYRLLTETYSTTRRRWQQPSLVGSGPDMGRATMQGAGLATNAQQKSGFPSLWKASGDVRYVESLGDSATPNERYVSTTTGGGLMLLSTGLGFTQSSGSAAYPFCIPSTTRTLSFDYNFITSEPAFWCEDPRFQDTFQVVVTLPGEEPQVVFSTDVDNVCLGEHETSLFTIPEPEDELGSDNITLATGWKRVKLPLNLTPYAATGNPVEIRFEVVDRGDSFWDSAVLLRNIVEDTN